MYREAGLTWFLVISCHSVSQLLLSALFIRCCQDSAISTSLVSSSLPQSPTDQPDELSIKNEDIVDAALFHDAENGDLKIGSSIDSVLEKQPSGAKTGEEESPLKSGEGCTESVKILLESSNPPNGDSRDEVNSDLKSENESYQPTDFEKESSKPLDDASNSENIDKNALKKDPTEVEKDYTTETFDQDVTAEADKESMETTANVLKTACHNVSLKENSVIETEQNDRKPSSDATKKNESIDLEVETDCTKETTDYGANNLPASNTQDENNMN